MSTLGTCLAAARLASIAAGGVVAVALLVLPPAATPALANPCSAQCRHAHNQCRIQTKGAPMCDGQLAQCLRSCLAERPGGARYGGGGIITPSGPGSYPPKALSGPGPGAPPVANGPPPSAPPRGIWRFWRREPAPPRFDGPRVGPGDGPRGAPRY